MIMNGFATESHTVFGRTAYIYDRSMWRCET